MKTKYDALVANHIWSLHLLCLVQL